MGPSKKLAKMERLLGRIVIAKGGNLTDTRVLFLRLVHWMQ